MTALPPPSRRRTGWLLPVLVVVLVAVPIAEVYLLIQVGQRIGVLATVAILVAEAFLGAWLMRREGSRAWTALQRAIGSGRMPAGELADAALVLVGGLLLMLPGFVTDVFGLVVLVPFTRPLARKALAFFLARGLLRSQPGAHLGGAGGVITGETVEAAGPGEGGGPVVRGEVGPS